MGGGNLGESIKIWEKVHSLANLSVLCGSSLGIILFGKLTAWQTYCLANLLLGKFTVWQIYSLANLQFGKFTVLHVPSLAIVALQDKACQANQ